MVNLELNKKYTSHYGHTMLLQIIHIIKKEKNAEQLILKEDVHKILDLPH